MIEETLDMMFLSRTHHRRILIGSCDVKVGSRMGGRPPACVADSPPRCPICAGTMEYLFTLADDVLSRPVARGMVLSAFCCRGIECRMKSGALINISPIVFLVHSESVRAERGGELDSAFEGRSLVLGPLCEDPRDEEGEVRIDRSKLGGCPGYIQAWGDDQAEKARVAGCDFLFQWSESGYPRDMKTGPEPFLGGVVYVFSRLDSDAKIPTLARLLAFFQFT
jgi:hypothetical protein